MLFNLYKEVNIMKDLFYKIGEGIALTKYVSKKAYSSVKNVGPSLVEGSKNALNEVAIGYHGKEIDLLLKKDTRSKNPVQMEMDL